MMLCAHKKLDVSPHPTNPRPGTQVRVEEEAAPARFGGWLPGKKETHRKNRRQGFDDCCHRKNI